MKNQLKETFVQCKDCSCLSAINEKLFGVSEQSDGVCRQVVDNGCADFKVENKTEKSMHLLAIDHCIWNDGCGHKKCDFALFNDSHFSFIELKCRAKMKNWSKERSDAADKFRDTLNQFISKKIDFSKHELELYIAFGNRPYTTGSSTRSQVLMDEFSTKYNATLLEGNHKTFE